MTAVFSFLLGTCFGATVMWAWARMQEYVEDEEP